MPTTTERRRALAVEPAEVSGTFIRAALDANQNWTKLYLDGLERALDFQLQVAESYAAAGNQYMGAAAALADRVDRARSEVTEAVAQTVEEAAKTRAEIVAKTADRAAKTQEIVSQAAERAAKTQSEVASTTADRAAKTQETVTKTVEKAAKAQAEVVTGPTEEPLPDYDALTAEQVVSKLPAVSQRTLAKVGAYERAHQARATVLSRVESLTAKEPAPRYDDLTVAEIQQLLNRGDEALAKRVRDYERTHAARSGVLQATERQLKQA